MREWRVVQVYHNEYIVQWRFKGILAILSLFIWLDAYTINDTRYTFYSLGKAVEYVNDKIIEQKNQQLRNQFKRKVI